MKSPARLGDSEPTTSTPSTGVPRCRAGDSGRSGRSGTAGGAVASIVCAAMPVTLGTRRRQDGRRRRVSDRLDDVSTPRSGGLGAPARRNEPGALRIGSLAGVDVFVRTSWLLVAALIAYVMAPLIDQV